MCLVEGDRALGEAGRSGNLAYFVQSESGTAMFNPRDVKARFPDVPCFTLENRIFSELTDVRTGTGILGAARIPPGGDFQVLHDASGGLFLIVSVLLQFSAPSWLPSFGVMHACQISPTDVSLKWSLSVRFW